LLGNNWRSRWGRRWIWRQYIYPRFQKVC